MAYVLIAWIRFSRGVSCCLYIGSCVRGDTVLLGLVHVGSWHGVAWRDLCTHPMQAITCIVKSTRLQLSRAMIGTRDEIGVRLFCLVHQFRGNGA